MNQENMTEKREAYIRKIVEQAAPPDFGGPVCLYDRLHYFFREAWDFDNELGEAMMALLDGVIYWSEEDEGHGRPDELTQARVIAACEAIAGLQCAEHFAELYELAAPYMRKPVDREVIDRLLNPKAAIYRWQGHEEDLVVEELEDDEEELATDVHTEQQN
jgi:hypothetical protein